MMHNVVDATGGESAADIAWEEYVATAQLARACWADQSMTMGQRRALHEESIRAHERFRVRFLALDFKSKPPSGEWSRVKAMFDAARAAELKFEAENIYSIVTCKETGPERDAQADLVPAEVWEEGTRLTDIRCDAEDLLIACPAPDLSAAIFKIEYSRWRWEDMEGWPDSWWDAVMADLRNLSAPSTDPHMGWLAERYRLLDALDASYPTNLDGDPSIMAALSAISQRISDTPATTRDGILAKALFITDLHIGPDDGDDANRVIAEAKALGVIECAA